MATVDARAVQVTLFRRMTPEQKLQLAAQVRDVAWDLKAAGVRLAHPELSDHEVQDRVRQVFWHAGT